MWEIVLHCLCIICLQSTLHTHAFSHSRAPFGHASIYSPHFSGDFGKFFVPLQLDSVDPWNKLWPFPLEILFAHFDWLYPKSIPIGACMPCAPCALADWPVSPWAAPLCCPLSTANNLFPQVENLSHRADCCSGSNELFPQNCAKTFFAQKLE